MIVPVYNIKDYIEKCVVSIVRQSYKELEIILVDDGSTDGCNVICDKLAEHDQRIKVIHKQNGGLSDARNVGIDNSSGKYISFVDGDDLLHPMAMEIMVNNLELNNADISEGGVVRENEIPYEKFISIDFENKIGRFDRKQALIEMYAFTKYLHVMAWAKVYKRELFQEIRFPQGLVHEDMAVMYLLYEKANKIVGTKAPVYFVSQREGSITRSIYNQIRLDCWCKHYFEPLDFYKNKDNEIYNAVEAGYLKDAINYWKIANNAKDKQMTDKIMMRYKQCINRKSLSLFKIKRKVKILLFALIPELVIRISS